jgi:hypothetical protein
MCGAQQGAPLRPSSVSWDAGGDAAARDPARGGSGGGAAGAAAVAHASGGSGGKHSSAAGAGGHAAPAQSSSAAGAEPADSAAGSGGAAAPAADVDPIIAEPLDDASYLFDDSQIRTYNIIIDSADLAMIDRNPNGEQSVPAGLEFEGKSYGPYSVRYKGASGAFRPPCTDGKGGPKTGKCSLKLDFNDADSDARFFGLKKLNLHSMNADVSMLRDRLGYRMYREMDVAAPRAVHARVEINGELEGLFIAVEQIDGVFARSRFREGGKGNVYKEVWPLHDDASVYVEALETNEAQADVQHMLDFRAAVLDSTAAAERFYDRNYIMRYLAADRVTINDDGVARFLCGQEGLQGNNPGPYGNHNYYWYEEVQSGRLWLVPWDLDKGFNETSDVRIYPAWTASAPCSCNPNPAYGNQWPATCDPLFEHIESALPDYEKAVDQFLAGPFAKDHIDELIQRWSDQIRQYVSEAAKLNAAPSEADWDRGVDELRQIIEEARANRGLKY